MKNNTPVNSDIVKTKIGESGLSNLGLASIREIVKLVNQIEKAAGVKFIRMEMGVPGLLPPSLGIEAEIEALRNGVASVYPNIEGYRPLKRRAQDFLNYFWILTLIRRGVSRRLVQ